MTISRRRFLGSSAALTTAAAVTTATKVAIDKPRIVEACQATLSAPLEVIALSRLAFGLGPDDVAAFQALGSTPDERLAAYVEQQLNPETIDDSACDARLAAARLKIKYDTINEARPLNTLTQQTAELWERTKYTSQMNWAERIRPYNEIRTATWLRAVYSKRQLFEVLTDFWHNHFNIHASSDVAIAATFPVYDRDVIRKNCLGNFRAFLEDVAKSTAMMHYLDNVSNRIAGGEGGNENYARELFELHTLGSDNYLKFYDDRRAIGTIEYNGEKYARGYIDDDVYEASYCLTGWSIANGHWSRTDPNNGTFYYDANWHFTGRKTVLSIDGYPNIPSNQAPEKDGKDILDLLARHPGTARFLCTKLCRRLIADDPPSSIVDAAVATWMTHRDAPDQIKQVVRTIVLSNEFKTTWGRKVKRPLEAIWAYLRATRAELPVDVVSVDGNDNRGGYWGGLFWNTDLSGHKLFGWNAPTGHPDIASHWANTNGMLKRWNLPHIVTQEWSGNVVIDLARQTNMNDTCINIVDFWINRLCGYTITAAVRQELIAFMAQEGDPNQPPQPTSKEPDWGKSEALVDRLNSMVQLLAMCPDFHLR
jgi:uncharacterized protein (DUF1800 family)